MRSSGAMRTRSLRPARPLLLGAPLCLLLAACTAEQPASGQHYTVEGTVVQQMDPRIGRELLIDHEAIPGFIDSTGERTLMPPMTMTFPVADDVELHDLQNGDRIRFELRVDWEGSPPYEITSIERLE